MTGRRDSAGCGTATARSGILELFPFYRDADPESRRRLETGTSVTTLETDTFFAHEGCPLAGVVLIGRGRLRVYKTSDAGREIKLYRVRPGQLCVLNVLAALKGGRAPATARVEEAVTAVHVPNEVFHRWLDAEPTVQSHVFDVVAGGVVDIMGLVEEIAFKKLDVRLAEYLCRKLLVGPGQARELKATHESIAADLGSAREVISRLLKEFERHNAVVLGRGRLALGDRTALMALAGAEDGRPSVARFPHKDLTTAR